MQKLITEHHSPDLQGFLPTSLPLGLLWEDVEERAYFTKISVPWSDLVKSHGQFLSASLGHNNIAISSHVYLGGSSPLEHPQKIQHGGESVYKYRLYSSKINGFKLMFVEEPGIGWDSYPRLCRYFHRICLKYRSSNIMPSI